MSSASTRWAAKRDAPVRGGGYRARRSSLALCLALSACTSLVASGRSSDSEAGDRRDGVAVSSAENATPAYPSPGRIQRPSGGPDLPRDRDGEQEPDNPRFPSSGAVEMPAGSGDWLGSAPMASPASASPGRAVASSSGGDSGLEVSKDPEDYPDPTELDYYRDYPEDPPRSYQLDDSLRAITENMEPGEWRQLPPAPYLGEALWADKAVWDSQRKRISYLGMHGIPERPVKWVMWDVDEGLWYRQKGDEFHPYAGIHSRWGYRSYGRYTQLPDGSNVFARFNRLWKQDPETLEWQAWAMSPCYTEIGNIEAFPEMGEQGAIISFGAMYGGAGETHLCAYDIASAEWRELPQPRVQGRHSLMRYNPIRDEVLLLGGDASYRAAQALQPDGTLTDLPDAPRNTRIRTDQLTVDPVSGDYLLMARENDDSRDSGTAEFFGYDVSAGKWYLIDRWRRESGSNSEWIFNYHAQPVATAVPEYGVTMWLETTRPGVYLYKHDTER